MAKVWIVFEEWQTGCEDAAVLTGVCATQAGAEALAAETAKMYAADPYNKTIWMRNPKTGAVDPDGAWGEDGWDLDIHVEAREVQP